MCIELHELLLIIFISVVIGAILGSFIPKQNNVVKPKCDDDSNWDIGAYSDEWWQRDRSEPDASEDD